ncbi:MAG: hypothetical protein J0I18_07195 [Actinobacteria bacterium]|nr:hypothetical protein [Actinomycetota bacterium]
MKDGDFAAKEVHYAGRVGTGLQHQWASRSLGRKSRQERCYLGRRKRVGEVQA